MSDQTKVAQESGQAAGSPRPRKVGGRPSVARSSVERRASAERHGTKPAQKAGHAMEPPPVIRPKTKPARATGEAKPVGEGDKAIAKPHLETKAPPQPPTMAAPVAPAAPAPPAPTAVVDFEPSGKKKPRSFRTAKPMGGLPGDAAGAGAGGGAATGTATGISAVGMTGVGQVTAAGGPKGARRIKLSLSYVSPWSTAKMAFLLCLAAGVAFVVMVFVLWTALNHNHVFMDINDMVKEVAGAEKTKELNLLQYVERGRIMSGAMLIAAIDVVIGTILATLGAVVYNILSALVGGVRVTLKES